MSEMTDDKVQRFHVTTRTTNGVNVATMTPAGKGKYVHYAAYAKLETELQTVLQRESGSQARHDAKLDALETELRDTKKLLEDERGVYMDALDLMQMYNGRSVHECIDMARKVRKGNDDE